MKPRLLLAGRTRYRLPLDESLHRKFAALERLFELRVLGTAEPGSASANGTFRLVAPVGPAHLEGALFHLTFPFRVAKELRGFRPDAVVVQGAHEAAAALLGRRLAGIPAQVVLDVHGDWRTVTRLYGSPTRRLLNPLADRLAAAAVRRADAVRTVSGYTTGLVRELGVEPAAVFPAFMDLEPFLSPPLPLPAQPAALFVGVLEHYKDIDGLAEAWRRAAPRLPGAMLHLVGRGSRRHVVEALCRGRPIVATRVGGIRDVVSDGLNGILVEPRGPGALAEALVRVLCDRELAERLATAARPSVEPWLATPEQYAERLLELVSRLGSRLD